MYVPFVVAALLLLVAHLVASAIHLEWKTNTLMKMTQTTGLFLSGFVSFSLLPLTLFLLLLLSLLRSFSGGGGYKSSKHAFPLHCICTYLLLLNICLHSTWTKFQTPATSPQLNFTLFKHTLRAASAMSPICAEPHWRLRCMSVFVVHLCLIFVGLTCGKLRGKDHNATLWGIYQWLFQKSFVVQIVR